MPFAGGSFTFIGTAIRRSDIEAAKTIRLRLKQKRVRDAAIALS
jgi:hypothetical protein